MWTHLYPQKDFTLTQCRVSHTSSIMCVMFLLKCGLLPRPSLICSLMETSLPAGSLSLPCPILPQDQTSGLNNNGSHILPHKGFTILYQQTRPDLKCYTIMDHHTTTALHKGFTLSHQHTSPGPDLKGCTRMDHHLPGSTISHHQSPLQYHQGYKS